MLLSQLDALQAVIGIFKGDILSKSAALFLSQVDPAIPQSSVPTPPDDAFWDRRNTEAISITAMNRARLLQPAHPPALTPGPPIDPSQAGPSSDGAAVQLPFGLDGSSQPTEGAASDSSQQAQVRSSA
jgi:hypothetical protein